MSGCMVMSKSQLQLGLSSMEPKQGIVSVLAPEAPRPPPSLRRTLSADMMSKIWLSQNGFVSQSQMKKIASSQHLSHCISEYSSSEDDDQEQEQEVKKKEVKAGELDIWSLIVSQSKNKDQEQEQSPYVHPLVKKSAGALSKNSLEVCTESLGSETGSDGFSSNPSSEMGDTEEDDHHPQQQQQQQQEQSLLDYEDVKVVKYNFSAVGKKLPPPSFPPPLASLSSRGDGASLRMSPRRENGRLVLEAVSVSAQNNFKAERHDGRLVLTLLNSSSSSPQQEQEQEQETVQGVEELEEYFGQDETDHEEDEETEEEQEMSRGREIEIVMDQQAPKTMSSGGVIKLHRLALMMNKSASLATMNNQVVKFKEEGEEESQLAQSLPPVGTAAASLNAYEYCWRDKPTAAQAMGKNSDNKYIISKNNSSIIANNKDQDQWVVIKAVQNMNGCKDHRRSLFREPYCIATS